MRHGMDPDLAVNAEHCASEPVRPTSLYSKAYELARELERQS